MSRGRCLRAGPPRARSPHQGWVGGREGPGPPGVGRTRRQRSSRAVTAGPGHVGMLCGPGTVLFPHPEAQCSLPAGLAPALPLGAGLTSCPALVCSGRCTASPETPPGAGLGPSSRTHLQCPRAPPDTAPPAASVTSQPALPPEPLLPVSPRLAPRGCSHSLTHSAPSFTQHFSHTTWGPAHLNTLHLLPPLPARQEGRSPQHGWEWLSGASEWRGPLPRQGVG